MEEKKGSPNASHQISRNTNAKTNERDFYFKKNSVFSKKITLFKNTFDNSGNGSTTVAEFIESIKNNTYKTITEQARKIAVETEHTNQYNEFKRSKIPAVTLSAHVSSRDKSVSDKIIEHSGLIQIDIDNDPDVYNTKEMLKNDEHTAIMFVSIGGRGIKVAAKIETNGDPEYHRKIYKQIETYYKNRYNIKIDPSVKDILRLCFVSHDPDIYTNENAKPFALESNKENKSSSMTPDNAKLDNIVNVKIQNAKRIIEEAGNGERHNARFNAGRLIGGLVGGGLMQKYDAIATLEPYIMKNTTLNRERAMKDFSDGIDSGTKEPFSPEKLIQEYNNYTMGRYGVWKENKPTMNGKGNHTNQDEHGKKTHPLVTFTKNGNVQDVVYKNVFKALADMGFACFENMLNTYFVKIVDNIVEVVKEKHIRVALLEYIDTLPYNNKVSDFFNKNLTTITNTEKLQANLPTLEQDFLFDTENTSYAFYLNGVVEITAYNVVMKQYSELGKYVWKNRITNREFSLINDADVLMQNDYYKLMRNLCTHRTENGNIFDQERFNSLIKCIGYMLHTYQNIGKKKIIIITETSDGVHPEGDTGKGVLMQGVRHFRNVTIIDGKHFDPKSQFCFADITEQTQIVFLNDAKKGLVLEPFYNIGAEGFFVERKYQQKVFFPSKNVPKLCISTNHTIVGTSSSDKTRRFDMEITRYYTPEFSPRDEFGRWLFEDWDDAEWNTYDNVMVHCTQEFLTDGKIPKYESKSLINKQVTGATSPEFWEFAETEIPRNTKVPRTTLYENFLEYTGLHPREYGTPNAVKFGVWIKTYCNVKNLVLHNNATIRDGIKKVRCYLITDDDTHKQQIVF